MGTIILTIYWVFLTLSGLGFATLGGSFFNGTAVAIALFGLFFIVLTLGVGFLPIWIALARRHQDKTAIVLLNVFTDWTVIGWIGALVWSVTGVRRATWER